MMMMASSIFKKTSCRHDFPPRSRRGSVYGCRKPFCGCCCCAGLTVFPFGPDEFSPDRRFEKSRALFRWQSHLQKTHCKKGFVNIKAYKYLLVIVATSTVAGLASPALPPLRTPDATVSPCCFAIPMCASGLSDLFRSYRPDALLPLWLW